VWLARRDGRATPTDPHGHLEALRLEVAVGQRAMVVGDLLLPETPTPTSEALAGDLAQTLRQWSGPGVLVIAGNLFFGAGAGRLAASAVRAALHGHTELARAIGDFAGRPQRRLVVLPGVRDPEVGTDPAIAVVLGELGIEIAERVELDLATGAGRRRVHVVAGAAHQGSARPEAHHQGALAGLDRLEDPSRSARFVTSRTLYRRLGHYLWVPPVLAVLAALAVRVSVIYAGVARLSRRAHGPNAALGHAYHASWSTRVLFTLAVVASLELALAVAVALCSRRFWRAQTDQAGRAPGPTGAPAEGRPLVGGTDALDAARRQVADGAAGLVAGGGVAPELVHLDRGFFARPGATTEVVREHAGRLGLPAVFLSHRQASWLEIEAGADLHVRLLHADRLASATLLDRMVARPAGPEPLRRSRPLEVVAAWPTGASWPPAAGRALDRRRVRRVRRAAATSLFVAGLADLLSALMPPLRGHLHAVLQVLPLAAARAAGALVALAGLALMLGARGVLRGQRRAWAVSVALLAVTLVLHLAHGAQLLALALSAVVLTLLVTERACFTTASDTRSTRSAIVTLAAGAAGAVAAATVAIEVTGALRHLTVPGWPLVLLAATERLVGIGTVGLPDALADWVNPGLLAVGTGLSVVALVLLTRPVVDRRLSTTTGERRRAAEARARDIVRRHGSGTLDYFALRDDKAWFFHRDSLVAYGVFGGVCLASPDPIGPEAERDQVWAAFRHFADRHGWAVGVMGASEEWLPIYRGSGMRHLYIGDEAVVDVGAFSLSGGSMKGLRQAVGRVARYGYSAWCGDPADLDPDAAAQVGALMERHRRGDHERGFSMMLGRVFDRRDKGLLLTVVRDPAGRPVAVCQFVPAAGVGGYSLDLMRRDPGEHPNGLLDFALCSTIEHLRALGCSGLSLNFAAMRSTLDGETGDGAARRIERWALKRLSGVLQIESLWRFNAKYQPRWLPRYIVWESAERFVPTTVQILRAESLTEIPVLGRLLATAPARRLEPAE
jgi:lysylphosphatidylglycerol synthetase-like protein (DUF2156 family)